MSFAPGPEPTLGFPAGERSPPAHRKPDKPESLECFGEGCSRTRASSHTSGDGSLHRGLQSCAPSDASMVHRPQAVGCRSTSFPVAISRPTHRSFRMLKTADSGLLISKSSRFTMRTLSPSGGSASALYQHQPPSAASRPPDQALHYHSSRGGYPLRPSPHRPCLPNR